MSKGESKIGVSKIGAMLSGRSGIAELMEDLGAAMRDGGRSMMMLGGGNPGHIPEVQALWRRRLREIADDPACCDPMLADYDGPAGSPAFRAVVADFFRGEYGWDIGPANIAVTPGAQTAFFQIFTLLAGEMATGNHRRVLLPIAPEYIGYADQGLQPGTFHACHPRIESIGDREFKYHIDLKQMDRSEEIAAVCVSRPTNPSGNLLADEELEQLARFARQRRVPLIVDNAYGEPFPGVVFHEIIPRWDPSRVLVYSLSKLGLPGTRTAIVIADEELVRRLAVMNAIMGLANNNVGQAIVRPLFASGEIKSLCQQVIRPFYAARSALARQAIRETFGDDFPYRLHVSEGAFFLWLWLPELPVSSSGLYQRLQQRQVLVVPGEYFFYGLPAGDDWPHSRQCIRITFSQSEETLIGGIQVIAEELRSLHRASTG
jgi:valine--pyruvate aminotransferase